MSPTARKALLLTILGAAVLGGVAWQIVRAIPTPRVRTLANARITHIDAAARAAEIEFTHPRSGKVTRLNGVLKPDGQVFVDGEPATIADVRVGDLVEVKGMVIPPDRVEAEWVRVTRSPSTTRPAATQPSSAPAEP